VRYQSRKIYLYPNKIYYEISSDPPFLSNTKHPSVKLNDSVGIVMPFRYCEIEANRDIRVEVFQKAYFANINDTISSFNSSDSSLNRIWSLCKHTIKATSFAGVYIDGERERIAYEGDTYINMLSHLSTDTTFDIAKNTLIRLINNPNWPTEWNLLVPELFYQYTMYSGDKDILQKYYWNLKKKTLIDLENNDYLISTTERKIPIILQFELGFRNYKNFIKQIIGYKRPLFYNLRDIVDWPPKSKEFDSIKRKVVQIEGENDNYDFRNYNTVVNAYHYNSILVMSKIAKILGYQKDEIFFTKRAYDIKVKFNKAFFNNSKKIYFDGIGSQHYSLHANMYPLKFGLVDPKNKSYVINFIKKKGMVCSVYGAQFLLDALFENQEIDYAFTLLNKKNTKRGWLNMIDSGASMTFESWDVIYNPSMDLSHAWGTAPLNTIVRNIWGIKPTSPGFKSLVISPKFGRLAYSEIKVPTLNGTIIGSFKILGNKENVITLNVPKEINATLNLTSRGKPLFYHLHSGINSIKFYN